MTNHYIDLKNSDCIMIIGSNAAENHPVAFKWIGRAMDKGAKLIHVDPRFTRTSSKADIYAPLRSGTDIAFMGGMINYVLDDMEKNPASYNMEYVKQYTNAALIINPDFTFNDGLFGEVRDRRYTAAAKNTWKYADTKNPATDPTLKDPDCVFQLLKKHYSRYDVDTVCNITGTPKDVYLDIIKTYAETGKKGKAGTICYAMGATQHTYGTQNIRAYGILQLLLGNIGVAGGGINALRGTSNVQGSTDMCLLSHILPGYLNVPAEGDIDIETYLKRSGKHPDAVITPQGLAGDSSSHWWGNARKYIVSLLKAWYGSAATGDNEFCFNYLPKVDPKVNYTHMAMIEAMARGSVKGLWIWGQNPASSSPDANATREALRKLDWLVTADIWMNETSEFWKRPGVNPSDINTEVFVLPAACSYEKEGSISNSGRWAQWRYKAVEPPGEAMPDLEIMNLVMLKLKELYQADVAALNRDPIINLDWDYGTHITADAVAREVNGYDLSTGKLVSGFTTLKDDGSTSSGNWLYCNQYTEEEGNKCTRRISVDEHPQQIGLFSNWSWCWPLNRRIIYNRASVDLDGAPWDSTHPVILWDSTNKWQGDVPDGGWPPINIADKGARYLPFIMKPEGVACLWGYGLAEGPVPEVYEPWESPLDRNLMSGTRENPCAFVGDFMNERGMPAQYPYVGTTYRCTEHWQTGIMTRNLPWLVELMPDMYVEMDTELATEKGITGGDKVVVSSARGEITAVAVITKRLHSLQVGGKTIHHIGVIWHFGYSGMAKGDSGNILTSHVGDANTSIPEYKTFLCDVRRAEDE
ncbi:MAG: formate dehydrogenase-N subunit alpha [Dehalococcoidales bacterium]|nr:formate dehydrogenase-N subunit alpha [Dehalococcoidales bacterium]